MLKPSMSIIYMKHKSKIVMVYSGFSGKVASPMLKNQLKRNPLSKSSPYMNDEENVDITSSLSSSMDEEGSRRGEKPMNYAMQGDPDRAKKVLQVITEQVLLRQELQIDPYEPCTSTIEPIQTNKLIETSGLEGVEDDDGPEGASDISSPKMGYVLPAASESTKLNPIILVPGLCSSVLEVWQSPWNRKGNMSWHRSRLWLSVAKLGKQKVLSFYYII